jgi:hypothetical protein
MSKFLYLFWMNERGATPVSPEQMEQRMKSWMTWLDGLRKAGHLSSPGERLDATGALVRGKGRTVTDGPYAEAKDTIGGYSIIEAKNLEQAVELSKGCPILEGDGGLVEVRPIVGM